MLLRAGYGRSGTKKNMGAGVPPVGWPDQVIAWENFTGPSRSGLSVNQVTSIIVSLLLGANLNPETHILPQQPQEQGDAEHDQAGHDEAQFQGEEYNRAEVDTIGNDEMQQDGQVHSERENDTDKETYNDNENNVPEAACEEIVDQNVAVDNFEVNREVFAQLSAVFNNNIEELVVLDARDTTHALESNITIDEENTIVVEKEIDDSGGNSCTGDHDYLVKKRKYGDI